MKKKTRSAASKRTRKSSSKGPLKITLQPEPPEPVKDGVARIVLAGDDEGAIPRTQGKKRRGRGDSALSLRDEEGVVAKRPAMQPETEPRVPRTVAASVRRRKQPTEQGLSLRDDEASTIKRTLKGGKPGPVKITLQPEPETDPVMAPKTLEDLGLSGRSRKCLEQAGIRTVKGLTRKRPADLVALKNFGGKLLAEVREKLGAQGLTLRTDPWEFTPQGDVEALTLHADTERSAGGSLRGDDEGPPRRQGRKRKK